MEQEQALVYSSRRETGNIGDLWAHPWVEATETGPLMLRHSAGPPEIQRLPHPLSHRRSPNAEWASVPVAP